MMGHASSCDTTARNTLLKPPSILRISTPVSTSMNSKSSSPLANNTTGRSNNGINPANTNRPLKSFTVSPVSAFDTTMRSSADTNATTNGLPAEPTTKNTRQTKSE
jgi:hypothetical protein